MNNLKPLHIWLCWNYVNRDGKMKKMPISASGNATGTDAFHKDTWVSFDEAKAAMEKNHYSGVGFVIPNGFFFLDIDHMNIDEPYVKMMLERFDSYAEYSVSGGGIHIYGKFDVSRLPTYTDKDGKLRLDKAYYMKNPNNNTELYFGGLTNRFAVYTDDVIRDMPLRDCTDAVLLTLKNNMLRTQKERHSEKHEVGDKSLFNIVCNLRKQKNGEKFSRLYDDGDYSDFGTQSEADCALCAMIAFRTGPDPTLIDKVFRSSALYREKWEREDYRDATITAGIRACHNVFYDESMPHASSNNTSEANSTHDISNTPPEFIRFDKKTGEPYVVVPLLAKHIRKQLDFILVRDNGKQGLMKYVYVEGCYKYYSDDMMRGKIKQFIANYNEELVKMCQVSETLHHLNTDLNYVRQDELNANESLINFNNGLLSVSEDELTLLPHSPTVYSTIQIPCDWTGEPKPTPVFDAYLKTLTNNDREIARLLLEFIGVCISNIKGWRLKKSLFLVGEGDTGKSQLKSLVEKLLGKGNFIGIDLKEIEARFGTGAIYGTRLAGSSDMSFMTVDELKSFKKITGGDSLYAEFKGQQAFEFTYNGLLWFCMNRLPKFGGDDGKWVYNRIMVIHCPNVIPKEQQDTQLLDKMYEEREGIVFKAIRALQTVIRNGYRFSEPKSVTEAREQYMGENNTAVSFFKECMYPLQNDKFDAHCTTGRIYKVYQAWCKENNNGYAKTAKEFREALASYLGSTYADLTTRRNGNTYYKDYALTPEAKEQFSREYGV